MQKRFTLTRPGLVTVLALLCAACQSTSVPVPENGSMVLNPVSPSDPRFSRFELAGQTVREDGAWVFSHLTRTESDAEKPSGSISVLTNVTAETYYELPGLQGESIDDAGWATDDALILYSQAWKKAVVIELVEQADGPPQLTLQAASNRRRAPVGSDYSVPRDALAPAASYQQVQQPFLSSGDR